MCRAPCETGRYPRRRDRSSDSFTPMSLFWKWTRRWRSPAAAVSWTMTTVCSRWGSATYRVRPSRWAAAAMRWHATLSANGFWVSRANMPRIAASPSTKSDTTSEPETEVKGSKRRRLLGEVQQDVGKAEQEVQHDQNQARKQ